MSVRVLFVCQNDFAAPTEKQALGFAQQLTARGHAVAMAIRGDPETARSEGATQIEGLEIGEYSLRGRRSPRSADARWVRAFRPDLIHALNSRTATVAAVKSFADTTGAPVFVHFEDDEWRPHPPAPDDSLYHRVLGRHARRLASPLLPGSYPHSTPASLRWVAQNARALDALTPVLAGEVRRRLDRDCAVILPVTPRPAGPDGGGEGNRPDARTLEEELGDGPVALFTGTVWPVYLPDLELGMRAVADVRRRDFPLRLVHAGRVHPRVRLERVARRCGLDRDGFVSLGYLPYREALELLQHGSVLLQPGPPTDFNRLRLPSKMQAYLESGVPTITFAVGFAELLTDREEVLKTYTADPPELGDRIVEVLSDGALRERLAAGGRAAARRLFDPQRNADALLEHYARGLKAGGTQ